VPIVGICLIVLAIRLVQHFSERAGYRTDLPFEPRQPLSWRHKQDEEGKKEASGIRCAERRGLPKGLL
jgi:hypothetical protein